MKNIQVEYVLVACCFKLIVFGKGKDYLDYSVFITNFHSSWRICKNNDHILKKKSYLPHPFILFFVL